MMDPIILHRRKVKSLRFTLVRLDRAIDIGDSPQARRTSRSLLLQLRSLEQEFPGTTLQELLSKSVDLLDP